MTNLDRLAFLLGYAVDPWRMHRSPTAAEAALERQSWVVREWADRAVFLPYEEGLNTHVAVFGRSGGGKTRFNTHLLRLWLKAGLPALVLDPKNETHLQALAVAESVGVPAETVRLLSPDRELARETTVPWNPFTLHPGENDHEVTDAFAAIMHSLYENSWGPNLAEILINGTQVCVSHGLSPYELRELLRNEAYREALLRSNPLYPGQPYDEAKSYFQESFGKGESASKLSLTVRPVTNKLGDFFRNPYYNGIYNSQARSLSLRDLGSSLRLLCVHMNAAGGDVKAPVLLASLLTGQVYRSAMARRFAPPLLIVVDELGNQGERIADLFTNILRIGRSRGIHLVLVAQFDGDLPEDLRKAAFNTVSTRVCFRTGKDLADVIARDLSGTGGTMDKRDWYEVLRKMPRRHAVLQRDGHDPVVFRCAYNDAEQPSAEYLDAVLTGNQSRLSVTEDIADRRARIEALVATGKPEPPTASATTATTNTVAKATVKAPGKKDGKGPQSGNHDGEQHGRPIDDGPDGPF